MPKVEAYVVYTGHKEDCPDFLSLNKLYWDGNEDCTLDLRVKVLRDGKKGDILNQYVEFLKVLDGQIKIYGKTTKAVKEAIRICKERNILREYLKERELEVINIMISLFSQEQVQELYGAEKRQEGWEEGREEAWEEARAEFSKREAELKEEALEAAEKARLEGAIEIATNLLANTNLDIDAIVKCSRLPLKQVQELAKKLRN